MYYFAFILAALFVGPLKNLHATMVKGVLPTLVAIDLLQVAGHPRTKGEQRYLGVTISLLLLLLVAVPTNIGHMSRQRNHLACNGNAHEQTIFTSRQSLCLCWCPCCVSFTSRSSDLYVALASTTSGHNTPRWRVRWRSTFRGQRQRPPNRDALMTKLHVHN